MQPGRKRRAAEALDTSTDSGAGGVGAAAGAGRPVPANASSTAQTLPPLPKGSESLLKSLVNALPQTETTSFLDEVRRLQGSIAELQKKANEGAADERAAAAKSHSKQLEARNSQIVSLKAQNKALEERVRIEGSVPASVVVGTPTYKNLLQEKEKLAAELAALKGEVAAKEQAEKDRARSSIADAQAKGGFAKFFSSWLSFSLRFFFPSSPPVLLLRRCSFCGKQRGLVPCLFPLFK